MGQGPATLYLPELRVERRRRTQRSPSENVLRPVEGVNFQAVKVLTSLASAAALEGQASASKWLSAQPRLPRPPRQPHPLFHHRLDVNCSPEPILAQPTRQQHQHLLTWKCTDTIGKRNHSIASPGSRWPYLGDSFLTLFLISERLPCVG